MNNQAFLQFYTYIILIKAHSESTVSSTASRLEKFPSNLTFYIGASILISCKKLLCYANQVKFVGTNPATQHTNK